jgi:hypothetical protein
LIIHGGAWEGSDRSELPEIDSYLANHAYDFNFNGVQAQVATFAITAFLDHLAAPSS